MERNPYSVRPQEPSFDGRPAGGILPCLEFAYPAVYQRVQMQKTYHGSCHCGAVRFEADIDLAQPTYRCNCSICSRNRYWAAVVKPSAFRLLAGRHELVQYLFNTMQNEHYFCKTCGVRPYGVGNSPEVGEVIGVNVGCLEDATPEELAAAPVRYCDGRNDNPQNPPALVNYL